MREQLEKAYFLHRRFDDFDEFCLNVRDWNLDYRQLDCGPFRGELLTFSGGSMQFVRARLGRRLLQQGLAPARMRTFGLLADPGVRIFWRGIEISCDRLFVFPPDGELYSVSQADFDVFVISLAEHTIDEARLTLGLPDLEELLGKYEVFSCDPEAIFRLRRWLLEVNRELACLTPEARNIQLAQRIGIESARRLLLTLAQGRRPLEKTKSRKRDNALQKAEEYIVEHYIQSLTVHDLHRAAMVSERTLEYAFRERFDLTPKAYTLVYRLNSARKALRLADPNATKVYEIAQKLGFWHLSQFGVSYKKLFGELPSQTLRRPIASNAI